MNFTSCFNFIKKYISIIFIVIVTISATFVLITDNIIVPLYRNHFGYYTTIPNTIPRTLEPVSTIYRGKTNFLIIGANCTSKGCGWSFSQTATKIIYPKNLITQKKINTFQNSIQLQNKNVLFYRHALQKRNMNYAKLEFIIYNIDENKIIKTIQNTIPIKIKTLKTGEVILEDYYSVYPLSNGDFLLEIRKTGNSQNIYEKYSNHQNKFIVLKEKIIAETYLKEFGHLSYGINLIDNDNWGRDKEVLLSSNKLVIFKFDNKSKTNIINFYNIQNFHIEQIYSIKTKNIKYPLKTAEIIQLDDNNLLIAGGLKGHGLGLSYPVKTSYVLNTNTYKIKRTGDLKYAKKYLTYKINEKLVLFYESLEPISNEHCEFFVR